MNRAARSGQRFLAPVNS